MQVECEPPGAMLIRVTESSEGGSGALRVVPTQVAGTGMLKKMELRASDRQVRTSRHVPHILLFIPQI